MGHTPYPRYVYLGFASGDFRSADNLIIIIKISFRLDDRHCDPYCNNVRPQRFWIQRPRNLSESLAHLVDSIMRRTCSVASAGF